LIRDDFPRGRRQPAIRAAAFAVSASEPALPRDLPERHATAAASAATAAAAP
jgi:hypothetical protein